MPDIPAGALSLILSVVSTSAFSLIMKWSQERGYAVLSVGGVNYIAVAVAAAVIVSSGRIGDVSPGMWALAASSGIGFLVTYILLAQALRRSGVTIPTAAVQIAMVLPILAAVVLWHERLRPVQVAGVLISVAAIALLAPPGRKGGERLPRWTYLIVPAIFVASGATRVAQKAITEVAPSGQQPMLALIWFGAAAVSSVGMMSFTGWPTCAGEWLAGVCLGLVNLGSLVFLLRALTLIPAVIAFPAYSSLSLILVSSVAFLLWDERPGWRGGVGILAGLLSVALVNLH
jgi:drug/metabolite transporter (DMT)-like permease